MTNDTFRLIKEISVGQRDFTDLNADRCADYCFSESNATGFFLAHVTTCLCVNNTFVQYMRYSPNCTAHCPGNASQFCGGLDSNTANIYEFDKSSKMCFLYFIL